MAKWTDKNGRPLHSESSGRYEPAPYDREGTYFVPDYGLVRRPAANDSGTSAKEAWFMFAGIVAALIVVAVIYG